MTDINELQDRLSPHNSDYLPGSMFVYTEEELRWWVHLLTKRAAYRANVEKRQKDLYDAANYRKILETQYPQGKGD